MGESWASFIYEVPPPCPVDFGLFEHITLTVNFKLDGVSRGVIQEMAIAAGDVLRDQLCIFQKQMQWWDQGRIVPRATCSSLYSGDPYDSRFLSPCQMASNGAEPPQFVVAWDP